MEEIDAYRESLLSSLQGIVPQLSHILSATPAKSWHLKFGEDKTTPHFTLAHLRELEVHVFGLQLHRIVDENLPLLPLFNDTAWMANHYKPTERAQLILSDIANLRKYELEWLRALPALAWGRSARHPRFGIRTFQWWVELQLEYSQQHLQQLTSFFGM